MFGVKVLTGEKMYVNVLGKVISFCYGLLFMVAQPWGLGRDSFPPDCPRVS